MRRYIDLHVKPDDEKAMHTILEAASKLGYSIIGLVVDDATYRLMEECSGLKILRRIDVDALNPCLKSTNTSVEAKTLVISFSNPSL